MYYNTLNTEKLDPTKYPSVKQYVIYHVHDPL